MIKINLYGGPSSGKSTLAAQIYADFKLKNLKVELVQEYAKELVYQNHDMRRLTEAERIIILGEQFRRERILKDSVDYLVTDSPMLLTAYFHNYDYAIDIVKRHLKPTEFHFWVVRPKNFEIEGRSHDEEQSKQIDKEMKQFLSEVDGIKLHLIDGSAEERLKKIVKVVLGV